MDILYLRPHEITIPEDYIPVKHRRQTCEVIRHTGFILPIVVRCHNNRYILIDGYERLQCAKELAIESVPAICAEAHGSLLTFVLNYVRGRYCGIDVLTYTYQFLSSYDADFVARVLGREVNTVKKYAAVMNKLLAVLSREDFQRLKAECVKLRAIVACATAHDSRQDVLNCLFNPKPKIPKGVTPEAVKKAVEIQKNPEFKEAVDLVYEVGAKQTAEAVSAYQLLRQEVCPKLSALMKCLPPEVFNLFRGICR